MRERTLEGREPISAAELASSRSRPGEDNVRPIKVK